MGLLSLEHGKLAHRADFVLYGTAIVLLVVALLGAAPPGHGGRLAACGVAGLLAWSGIEYVLHRFVLHGPMPFRRWHALHHERPTALIGTPTLLTATLFATLAFLPAVELSDLWTACALTLGLLVGYLGYGVTHHALHHWRGDSAWLRSLKRWHALHHRAAQPCCYGVSSPFWDQVFGTAPKRLEVRQHTEPCAAAPYNPAVTDAHPPGHA
jgi:sterol desaturase/sphingolipid hydroxylase (fatty acid hydroxylase superfamily)